MGQAITWATSTQYTTDIISVLMTFRTFSDLIIDFAPTDVIGFPYYVI
jgi:hypothetical protein